MIFYVNFVLWCVLVATKQCLTVEECVQRRLGACTTIRPRHSVSGHSYGLPPNGFVLKTSMEINLSKNIHSFENNELLEKKRPVRYTLDNAALVTIRIAMNNDDDNDLSIVISLGKKYYRLAKLEYFIDYVSKEMQYSRYTPILPTFPYNLHLELTTNGTFSILADGNTEPFLKYQIKETGPFYVEYIRFDTKGNNDDLVAFVHCSMKYKPNCGIPRVDKLYGCRESVGNHGIIRNFNGFRKHYGKDVLFDEFIVVDTDYLAEIKFRLIRRTFLVIDFSVNSTEATFFNDRILKSVRTVQWFQAPASPYAVRVSITTDGEDDYVLKIINIQDEDILSLKLCGISTEIISQVWIEFYGPKLYFDCFTPNDNIIMSERPRKTVADETESRIQYHEDGYNYTKEYLYTRAFVNEPNEYEYEFGKSTEDWCPGEPQPEVPVIRKYADDSLEGIIEILNATLHSDSQKLNAHINNQINATADTDAAVLTELKTDSAQNNVTADTNAALLTELKKLNAQINATADTNAAVLNELKVISDTLTTHLRQNTTTVNNSN